MFDGNVTQLLNFEKLLFWYLTATINILLDNSVIANARSIRTKLAVKDT